MSRLTRAMPWLVGAFVTLVGLTLIDPLPVGVVHDDAMYVILAKSLATGHGYRWLHIPGAPPATHFPPGYPLVLAAIWKLFPSFPANVLAFKALNALFLGVAAGWLVVFAHRRLRVDIRTAAGIAIAGALSIPTLILSTLVLSEPLFLALLIPLLLVAEDLSERPAPTWAVAALGAAIGASMLVRTHGVALLAAVCVACLLRRRTRDAAIAFIAAALVLLPWQLWLATHQGFVPAPMRGNYESYTSWLARGFRDQGLALIPHTVERTGGDLLTLLRGYVGGTLPALAQMLLLVVLLALCAVGARALWRLARVTALFLAAYLAIVLVWPFNPSRFLSGIWPLVFCVPVLGAITIFEWRPALRRDVVARWTLVASSAATAIGFATYNVRGYHERWWSIIGRRAAVGVSPLVAWVRQRTRPADVVASNAEPIVYLYAGRLSLPVSSFTVQEFFQPPSVAASASALRGILAAYHVDEVALVAADSLIAAADAMALRHPPELVLRDTFPNGAAYTPLRQ